MVPITTKTNKKYERKFLVKIVTTFSRLFLLTRKQTLFEGNRTDLNCPNGATTFGKMTLGILGLNATYWQYQTV